MSRESLAPKTVPVKTDPPERDDVADIVQDVGIGPAAMIHIDPRAELEKFEAASELMRKLRPASIRATKPQDWIKVGEKVYLQGIGVERISPLWGFVFGKYEVAREDHEDGEYSYIVTGPVGCRRTGVVMQIVGGRSSSDPFFDDFDSPKPSNWRDLDGAQRLTWRRAHRIKPDPLEIRKAAVTNWMTRSASMLAGLRGLTENDLAAEGIGGVKAVEFGAGAKGGTGVSSDIQAERTKLRNEILRRVGGDTDAGKALLKEITSSPGGKKMKDGSTSKPFAGSASVDQMQYQWQFEKAWEKLKIHPTFGDDKVGAVAPEADEREPGVDDD